MQGSESIVGESAAPESGGGFVSIASNVLSNRHNFPMKREIWVIGNRGLSLQLL